MFPKPPDSFFQKIEIFQKHNHLIAAQSTRKGGVSVSPFESLNLGLFTEDSPQKVSENRLRFFSALGIKEAQTVSSYQVHGDNIKVADQPAQLEGYDALVTNKAGIFLTITIADCVPILIYDPVRQVVGAVHAGWRGTVAGIVAKTLQVMQAEYETLARDCQAFIGTCIDGNSYEVGLEVADHFSPNQKYWNEERQKFFVDLKRANKDQLLSQGVLPEQIEISPYSTVEHNDTFFSHRHEKGKTGRMLAVIGMKTLEATSVIPSVV